MLVQKQIMQLLLSMKINSYKSQFELNNPNSIRFLSFRLYHSYCQAQCKQDYTRVFSLYMVTKFFHLT